MFTDNQQRIIKEVVGRIKEERFSFISLGDLIKQCAQKHLCSLSMRDLGLMHNEILQQLDGFHEDGTTSPGVCPRCKNELRVDYCFEEDLDTYIKHQDNIICFHFECHFCGIEGKETYRMNLEFEAIRVFQGEENVSEVVQ